MTYHNVLARTSPVKLKRSLVLNSATKAMSCIANKNQKNCNCKQSENVLSRPPKRSVYKKKKRSHTLFYRHEKYML